MQQGLFHIGKRNMFINIQSLYLVKNTMGTSRNHFITKHSARTNNTNRRTIVFHYPHLYGRRMRTQGNIRIFINKERILHIAGGVFYRKIQGFKIVPIVFNFGTFGYGEAYFFKDVAYFSFYHRNRMARPQSNTVSRTTQIRHENDIFLLFSEIDRGMPRSQTDITRAGRQIMPSDLLEINAGCVGMYGAAILMAPTEGRSPVFGSRAISPQNRVRAVCANPEEAQFLHRYYGYMLCNRVAVRMAMVATFRADADRAQRFWDGVFRPDYFPVADPRKQLHTLLLGRECARSSAFAVRKSVLIN